MISVSVNGLSETIARLRRAEKDVPTALEQAVGRISLIIHRELSLQMSGSGRSDPFLGKIGATPPKLGVRTGFTRGRLSPGGRVFRRGNVAVSAVGSPDRHVLAHEEGTRITGKPYLRIPLAAAQTAAGQDRNLGRSLRGVKDIFLIKSGRGNLFLARQKGKAALELLYMLVRSVRLPARGTFRAVTERVRPVAVQLMGQAVAVQVRRANGG